MARWLTGWSKCLKNNIGEVEFEAPTKPTARHDAYRVRLSGSVIGGWSQKTGAERLSGRKSMSASATVHWSLGEGRDFSIPMEQKVELHLPAKEWTAAFRVGRC